MGGVLHRHCAYASYMDERQSYLSFHNYNNVFPFSTRYVIIHYDKQIKFFVLCMISIRKLLMGKGVQLENNNWPNWMKDFLTKFIN